MREGGAEALAFDVAALAGPQAALPQGRRGTPGGPDRCSSSISGPRSRGIGAT